MRAPVPVAAFHGSVRQATARLHRQLEAVMDLDRMTASKPAYRSVLSRLFGIHSAIDAALFHFDSTAVLGFGARRRSDDLVVDLLALGLDRQALRGLPEAPPLPLPERAAEIAGYLYVVEGSALGGTVISQVLRRRLGIGPETGGRFFFGAGAATAARWRAFLAAAEAQVGSAADRRASARAAVELFSRFLDWMYEGGMATGEIPT